MNNDIEYNRSTRSVVEHLSSPPSPDPFDLLATEIIIKIFVSVCPYISLPGERYPLKSDNILVDPLILSMVCKRWRAIAITYHPLWATFSIQPLRIGETSWDQWGSSKLRSYLTRSGTHPLDIRIGRGSTSNKAVISSILDSLSAHSKRWKSLSLHFPLEQTFLRQLDSLAEGQLPLLESVRFFVFSKGAAGKGGKFLRSPSLKRIIFDPAIIPKPILSHINWTNISEVGLKSCYFEDEQELRHILECLSTSTKVLTFRDMHVHIDSSSVKFPLAGKQTPIRMEKLRKLRLETGFDGLLGLFVCPYLEHLEITGDHYGGKEVEIVRFLENSSCPLTRIHLSLDTIEADPADQRECYKILQSPSLSKLKSISLTGLENWIVELLTFDSYKLLPSLEALRLDLVFQIKERGTKFLTSRIEELKKIVESRTRSHVPNQNESSTATETMQSNFIPHATLLKHCFFTFTLHTDQRRSPHNGSLAKTTLETLRLFCISRKIKTQLDIIFRDDDDDTSEYDSSGQDREEDFLLA